MDFDPRWARARAKLSEVQGPRAIAGQAQAHRGAVVNEAAFNAAVRRLREASALFSEAGAASLASRISAFVSDVESRRK